MVDLVLSNAKVLVALGGGTLATLAALARRPRLAAALLVASAAAAYLVQDRPVAFTTTVGELDADPPPERTEVRDPARDHDEGQE